MGKEVTEEEFLNLQTKLGHAMQSGVAMEHEMGSTDGTPKHLRVGVNMALNGEAALGKLLIDKGIITKEEYMEAHIAMMEQEVQIYEARLSRATGAKVNLA